MATLAASAFAGAQDLPRPRAGLTELEPANDPWLLPAAAGTDAKRGLTIDFGEPDRSKLFRLTTAAQFVAERRMAYRDKYPAFVVPGAVDDFNATDADTLGVRWHQRLAPGVGGGRTKKTGAMGIRNNAGSFPVRKAEPTPEAAVFNEELSAPDLEASVDVTLGGANHEFGLLLRASAPDLPGLRDKGAIEQWQKNSFVYVAATATRIVVGKRVAGKESPTLATKTVAAKEKFRLRFVAIGKSLSVYRDDELVASAEDSEPLDGRYTGLVGISAEGTATVFDDFRAAANYGDFAARRFAAMGILYRGPNVHHNPLYFEQRMIERHGHHLGNMAAPILAHGLFIVDFLLAPASAMSSKPWCCTSSDLYARPGELVPYQITPPMLDRKAKYLNLAAFAALGFLVP